jgi:16S rRNA pseudouridine516 synthase
LTKQRLDRLVALGLGCSRSQAKAMVLKGQISVDGGVCRSPDTKLSPGGHSFSAEGRGFVPLVSLTLMMHKPTGIISSTTCADGKPVLELVPAHLRRPGLFPAGRLDKMSEGLIILTDDGPFAHRMLSPKHKVPKTYFVRVDRPIVDEELAKSFECGVCLGEGQRSSPARLEIIAPDAGFVTIYEGIYHQVRRMFSQNNAVVTRLVRVRIGALWLDMSLAPGQSKILSNDEKNKLLQSDDTPCGMQFSF